MDDTKNPLIERAIQVVGRQSDLATAMGCAQQTVSKLLNNEIPIQAEQAVAIERATAGAVPKSALRPDLWPPAEQPEPAQGAA